MLADLSTLLKPPRLGIADVRASRPGIGVRAVAPQPPWLGARLRPRTRSWTPVSTIRARRLSSA
jgi:hypothetical protein